MHQEDLKGDPTCSKCKGEGYLFTYKKNTLYKIELPFWSRCECLKKQRISHHLKDLANLPTIPESPLYTMLSKNVFITSGITDFKKHLKYCLEKEGEKFSWRFVLDSRLLEIQFERDEEFKSLSELKKSDLLVLLLGHVGFTKHDALAGIISEAISNRLFENKPTWIHTYRSFNRSVVEYSEDLEKLIEEHFERVKLEKLGITKISLTDKNLDDKSKKIDDYIRGI